MPAFILSNWDERVAGVLLASAALALLGAAATNVAAAYEFGGNRTFLNALVAIVAVGWATMAGIFLS